MRSVLFFFILALATSLWNFFWHVGFSEGVHGCSTSHVFMHVHNLVHRFVNDCSFADWAVLLSGHIHPKSMHGGCGSSRCHQTTVHATLLLTCASTPTQACSLTLSGCSVQVNRVLTYHDLDKDLMKYAAFQTLVSGCCYGLANVNPSPSRLMSSSTVILSCTKYTAL